MTIKSKFSKIINNLNLYIMEFLIILIIASLISIGIHTIAKKCNKTYRDLYEEARDLNKMK